MSDSASSSIPESTGDPRGAETTRPIRRALVSVYDKTGLAELARALGDAGIEIVSTGSTAKQIAEAGVAVTPVEKLTDFPECLEGRVKTLHPRVHAGILADSRKPEHLEQIAELGVEPFDLVVVNLYPFTETVASGAGYDECVEQIDIGGPSMVRAAAKNHPSVAVVVSPESYGAVAAAVSGGGFTLSQRRALAAEAFRHTAAYDTAVGTWITAQTTGDTVSGEPSEGSENSDGSDAAFPVWIGQSLDRKASLRYGENPHQSAALYTDAAAAPGIAQATQLHGKEMSYNNYADGDAAWRAAFDQSEPCVAIIKHANPCGIAIAGDIAAAHRAAHACDPLSAFGGVIAANREVSVEMAKQVAEIFTEVIIAPSYAEGAVEVLQGKKNIRILTAPVPAETIERKQISGGALVQSRDVLDAPGDVASGWTKACGPDVPEEVLRDLEFAWRAGRAVKSNAIVLVSGGATVGVGMGQVNRVDSARLAVERAGDERAGGAVASSDAFFPFADGLQVLIDAGVRAVVQPGGSVRDPEVVEAAEKAGITMYMTGSRHFFH
ncbi:bifunctional phosphoribosylaminoimidazolecarboxamide formyltransferase/IMP cyclohydrolase [Dietzia sp.]|uniref:bifunctional phosphoribosylaminoimidazolecarboxamide formyltransferase/IMP cyclohydrolase n=1 Tax=Dietzia sp. TaxID=1871616 RepID=UPI002FDB9618